RDPAGRCRAPAAAAGMPGPDRRSNPRAAGATRRPGFVRCRRRARRSDLSNRAPRRYGPASVRPLLLLLLLLLGLLLRLRLLLRQPRRTFDLGVRDGLRQRP